MNTTSGDFSYLPDLAARSLGGSVMAANDEFFADKENLIRVAAPRFQAGEFDAKGQIYDGWETRRRREPGHDWAIIRLGAPGIVHGVVVDTAFFTGNYPERCSIEATSVDGYPSAGELEHAEWVTLVEPTPLRGDAKHPLPVSSRLRATHVRLSIHPDGGVARLRVHGEPLPDPRELAGLPVDLVAMVNGGHSVACSDSFFSRPSNLLQPGESPDMGDGWETARRRDDGNDWAVFQLVGRSLPSVAELSTLHFKGNAPASATLLGFNAAGGDPDELVGRADGTGWFPLLEAARLQPDIRHRFRLPEHARTREVTHVRLDIYPDGGLARLRLHGLLTAAGWDKLTMRWCNALPAAQAMQVLTADVGLPAGEADALMAARPFTELPPALAAYARDLAGDLPPQFAVRKPD